MEQLYTVFDPINALPTDASRQQIFDTVNATVYDTLSTFWPSTNETLVLDEIVTQLNKISPTDNATGNETLDQFYEAANSVTLELFKIVVEDFGFTAPGGAAVNGLSFDEQINAYYSVFTLIFGIVLHTHHPPLISTNHPKGYFFTTAGLVLIGIAILAWLSMLNEKRTWRHYIGIVSNFIIGLGVALLSVMLVNGTASDNLGSSPWTLPLLVFVLFIG